MPDRERKRGREREREIEREREGVREKKRERMVLIKSTAITRKGDERNERRGHKGKRRELLKTSTQWRQSVVKDCQFSSLSCNMTSRETHLVRWHHITSHHITSYHVMSYHMRVEQTADS